MQYQIITIGGATEDIFLYTNEGVLIHNDHDVVRPKLLGFTYGAKIKIDRYFSSVGGGAANTAVCLSRLGFKTAAAIAIGKDDRGANIISQLKQEKVATGLVQKFSHEITGMSSIVVNNNFEHVTFSIRGANTQLEITNRVKRKLGQTEWIYLTSLSGKWQHSLDQIFSLPDVKVVWNPGNVQLKAGKQALSKYLKQTHVLILNHDEARALVHSDKRYVRKPLRFYDDPAQLIKVINGWGPQIVVITLSDKGAVGCTHKQCYHVPSIKVRHHINTVGVGDAFGSTLLAGLIWHPDDLAKAMQLAAKNAAEIVKKLGAQTGLLRRKQLIEE
ncbi:MAG: carbohydrate kinase family protein [Candidatus Falkowbacteria bacterium]